MYAVRSNIKTEVVILHGHRSRCLRALFLLVVTTVTQAILALYADVMA